MSSTLAREIGFLLADPLKITASIASACNSLADDSPRTQRTDSITLDLPQPFGPTMPTRCPCNLIVVESTNDLKPEIFK